MTYKPETMGQAMTKAKRAKPPSSARFADWLDKMGLERGEPRTKAAAVQRRHDRRAVARMRKIVARHNRTVLAEARRDGRMRRKPRVVAAGPVSRPTWLDT